jgi:hypothetical protein
MSELETAAGERPAVTPDAIMELGMAFWGSKTLLSAVELGVFSELAGPDGLEGEVLRERLGLHPRSVADFFDALVALGMLERQNGRYANTPATELFLDRAKPSYIGGILEMANARLFGFWGSLTEGLRTGAPQNEVGASPGAASTCPRSSRSSMLMSVASGSASGSASPPVTFLPIRCRPRTCSYSGTSCTTGTWTRSACRCERPMTRCPTAAR